MTTRRQFVLTAIPATTCLLAATRTVSAQAARLEESDAIATSLAYRHDASKVDPKKSPTFVSGRNCANCQFFQGKGTDAWGACAAVGGKLVNSKGWCSVWVKKA